MLTDLAEVFRLGTAKAQENLNFRRYLQAHHLPEEPFQILANEVQQHVDCTACANCCRYSIVAVSQPEIESIARHLGTTAKAAALLYTTADPEGTADRHLKSTADACVFLDGSLCMVYEARPQTCRNFPHIAVGAHSLGSRPSSIARWAALCPILYNALERHKRSLGYGASASNTLPAIPPKTP